MLGCTTPPVENCVCSCGESGAIGASSGARPAISAGGVGSGGGGVAMMPIPELKRSDAAAADPVFLGTAPGARIIWGLPTIAGCLAVPPAIIGPAMEPPCSPPRALAAPVVTVSVIAAIIARFVQNLLIRTLSVFLAAHPTRERDCRPNSLHAE
jgi:hypothetical protein